MLMKLTPYMTSSTPCYPFLLVQNVEENNIDWTNDKRIFGQTLADRLMTSGADAIKKFTPSLGIPFLGV